MQGSFSVWAVLKLDLLNKKNSLKQNNKRMALQFFLTYFHFVKIDLH